MPQSWNNQMVMYVDGRLKKVAENDSVTLTGEGTFTVPNLSAQRGSFSGDVSVGGNLTVAGDIIAASTRNVMLGDNFVNLLAGNTVGGVDRSGGFTVSSKAVGLQYTVTSFTAGGGGDDPQFACSDPVTDLAAGDIIQISGTADGKNDGLFQVKSVTNTVVVVEAEPNAQLPFLSNQFVSASGNSATVTAIALTVFATGDGNLSSVDNAYIGTGVPCWVSTARATVSSISGQWQSLDRQLNTLQWAYDHGALANIEMTDGRPFQVLSPATGTANFYISSNADSGITVFNSDLTITTGRTLFEEGRIIFSPAMMTGFTLVPTSGGTPTIDAGCVVHLLASGDAELSVNDGTDAEREVEGVVVDGETFAISSIQGSIMIVRFVDADTPTKGQKVYLSAEAGKATTTLPTSGRVYELGTCVYEGGAPHLHRVRWNPRYICDL